MIPESGFPAFLDADVYEAITLHDNRGLAVVIKNGDGHHARFTFTRSRKQATRLKKVSQWVKEQGKKFETEKHVRLIITKYNQLGSIFSEVITSDGKVVQKTFKAYNGFGEFIGEAEAEERLIDVFYKLDTSGRPWFSRAESGVPTIILHNLLGFETLRLQSDQILLTNKTLTDVPEP